MSPGIGTRAPRTEGAFLVRQKPCALSSTLECIGLPNPLQAPRLNIASYPPRGDHLRCCLPGDVAIRTPSLEPTVELFFREKLIIEIKLSRKYDYPSLAAIGAAYPNSTYYHLSRDTERFPTAPSAEASIQYHALKVGQRHNDLETNMTHPPEARGLFRAYASTGKRHASES